MQDDAILLEREEPLSRLESAFRAAARGRGRVVSIEGEAGIGKTSMVYAFAAAHQAQASVHIGGCEHLTTPEPLGPLRDVARESQGRFTLSATSHLASFESLLRLLTDPRGAAVLVIEDLHWADDLTLDLLRYLARRIRTARVLVVVTSRNDEGGSQGRLAALWADMPRDAHERIELPALSLDAVSTLAQALGRPAREVFEATGGNPFHVTEYLATSGEGVPRSVQDATLARAARLTAGGRRALDCASIFPRRIDEPLLRVLAEDGHHVGVEECLRAGMLEARNGALGFRHELARRAVHEAISPLRRRDLHAAALAVLKGRDDGRAAEAAHHAEQAGAAEDLVLFSVKAAQEAAAVGAHSDAVAHLAKALAQGDGPAGLARADLLERQAEAGEQCGAFDIAAAAIAAAIAAREAAGDVLGLGNALRISARLQFQHGGTELAEQHAQDALEVLRDHTETWQYAMALSGQAQLDMLASRAAPAISRGLAAMAMADRLGRSDIYIHALTNVTAAQVSADTDAGIPQMQAAIGEARRRGELDSLPRLYSNLAYVMAHDRRHDGLFQVIEDGIDVAVARDNAPIQAYMRGSRATALLDLGRLKEAMTEAESVVYGPYPKGTLRFPALLVLSRARVRLGLAEGGVVDQARALPTAQRDVMRRCPIAVTDAEAHWLGEKRPDAPRALRAAFEQALSSGCALWALAETALWLKVMGEPVSLPAAVMNRMSPAYRLHIAGRWLEAAAAWRDRGCPYEQALALSIGEEAARREALALFDDLGARPAARRLRRTLRQSGVRGLPVGPRSARRNDPAGLTPRQNQVLTLLAEGLSNSEIAERLRTSAKTVEHHVGAVLAALDAGSRLRAVHVARERGLLAPKES
ncbi:AAA family ATPase [Phenylobacterium sp.]|uniref:AAA family ATPase n=1 Tax=Phenylobacterium sp. TaxID=1871053 RepID=UPI0025E54B06|nr:AAA family ATPase [Phenylobacterium sp.]